MIDVTKLQCGNELDFHHSVVSIQAQKKAHQGDVGTDILPKNELIRFKVPQNLGFPGEALEKIVPPESDKHQFELHVNFLSLTGASGVMPRHFSERVIEKSKQKDDVLKEFLDIFNHRLISLYHRAWEKYRLPLQLQHQLASGKASPIVKALQSFVGSDCDLQLGFGGLYASQIKSAQSLKQVLRALSGCEVEISENIGKWISLDPSEQTQLPSASLPDGKHAQLGLGAVIGTKVWDVNSTIEISIYADSAAAVCRLMPNGTLLSTLRELASSYLPAHIKARWTLVAKHIDMPTSRLSQTSVGLGQGTALAVGERLMLHTVRIPVAQ